MKTLVIDSIKNDDWMKTLPGYQDEVEVTRAARKLRKNKPKVVIKKQVATIRISNA